MPSYLAGNDTVVRTLLEDHRPKGTTSIDYDTTNLDVFWKSVKLGEEGVLNEILRAGVGNDEGPSEIVSESDIVVDASRIGEVLS